VTARHDYGAEHSSQTCEQPGCGGIGSVVVSVCRMAPYRLCPDCATLLANQLWSAARIVRKRPGVFLDINETHERTSDIESA
jgi:hypothetical protein